MEAGQKGIEAHLVLREVGGQAADEQGAVRGGALGCRRR